MKLHKDIIAKARVDSGQKEKKRTRRIMCWGGFGWCKDNSFQLKESNKCDRDGMEMGDEMVRRWGGQSMAIFSVKCVITSSFEVRRKRGRTAHLGRKERA